MQSGHHDSMLDLLGDLVDNRLDPAAAATLESMIIEDPAARRLYIDYMQLHAMAPEILGADRSPATPRPTLTIDTQPTSAPPRRDLRIVGVGVIAALLLINVLTIGLYTRPTVDPEGDDADRFASITSPGGADRAVADEQLPDSRRHIYSRGGRMDLAFASGTVMNLTGAVDFAMDHPMLVSVSRGRANFSCPQQAKGFTVALPHGVRVVGLGAEFELRVPTKNRASVHVRNGSVRVETPDLGRRIVGAGHSVDLAKGRVVAASALDPDLIYFDRFDGSTLLNPDDPALIRPGDLLPDRSTPLRIGHRVVMPPETTVYIEASDLARDRIIETGLITPSKNIGESGKTLYLSWTTQAGAVDPQGYGGLSLFNGRRESLFIGKARDVPAWSYDYKAERKTPIDGDPTTPEVEPIGLDTRAHLFVVRIDYVNGPERVRIWIDPDRAAEPMLANADLDDMHVIFDRIRLKCGRGLTTYPDSATVEPWSFDDLRMGTTWSSVTRPWSTDESQSIPPVRQSRPTGETGMRI